MRFIILQCKDDPAYFIATDPHHVDQMPAGICPDGAEAQRVGEWDESEIREGTFNKEIARNTINESGFYRFESKYFDVIEQPPSGYAPAGGAA